MPCPWTLLQPQPGHQPLPPAAATVTHCVPKGPCDCVPKGPNPGVYFYWYCHYQYCQVQFGVRLLSLEAAAWQGAELSLSSELVTGNHWHSLRALIFGCKVGTEQGWKQA